MKYSISAKVLRNYMNVDYVEELTAVGYDKKQRILPPNVVRKFIELHGQPLKNDEI